LMPLFESHQQGRVQDASGCHSARHVLACQRQVDQKTGRSSFREPDTPETSSVPFSGRFSAGCRIANFCSIDTCRETVPLSKCPSFRTAFPCRC
jgi:hypothetical protein